MINRRNLLKNASVLMGSSLTPGLVHALSEMSHHGNARGTASTTPEKEDTFRSLDDKQLSFLNLVCELIIPETDTPGAFEAAVPQFIDLMLTDWYADAEKKRFLDGIDSLIKQFRVDHKGEIAMAPFNEQQDFVYALDVDAWQARQVKSDPLPVFATIKELTLIGYYTSEIGETQELKSSGPVAEFNFGDSGPPGGRTRY